jgi:putative ABC transport system permease protein
MALEIRTGVRRLFRVVLRRRESLVERLDEELSFHLEARTEQLVARGLTPEAARAEAIRRLGGTVVQARARLLASAERKERRMAWREWFEDLAQDTRYAARGLARRPGLTLVALLTLAVGIGANTAIFSAVNALLLRRLPFREPGRLMDVTLTPPADPAGSGSNAAPWSFAKFRFFRGAQTAFSNLALYSQGKFNLLGREPERLNGEWVSGGYLTTLGVAPALGRDFPAGVDSAGGAPRLALISDALWQRRFDADPAVVGRSADLDGDPFTIIGVLPRGFRGLGGQADVLVPITTRPADELEHEAWSLEFSLIGRLAPGVTPARARAEVNLLGPRVYQDSPMQEGAIGRDARSGWSADARPLDQTRVAPGLRRSLLVLMGAVVFVLLIACVNLANLLLGRAAARRREMAVRLALGVRRGRLVRMLLTESVLLALLGGAAGLLVAGWATRILSAANPLETLQAQGLSGLGVVQFSSIRLDGPALAFTALVALLVGLLFGLIPALGATRPGLTDSLKDDGAATGRGFRLGVSRHLLVVAEVALAIVLLAGAGLMIRSLDRLLSVDPGFDAQHLLTLRMTVAPGDVTRDSLAGFYDRLLERLEAVPGVTAAGLADCPPLAGGCNGTIITFPDRPPVAATESPSIGVHVVTPGWFAALHVPLKRGRLLGGTERVGQPRALVISEAAAERYWHGEDPIGKRAAVWQGGFDKGATVVGIVGDVRFGTIDSVPAPEAYMAYAQSPRSYMTVFLRTRGEPRAIVAPVRTAVHELAPETPIYDIQTMEQRVGTASAQARFSAVLLGLFAAVALALAALGIYGVMAFAVGQRTREIGIRMALGAEPSSVLGLVVREGVVLAALGLVIGLAGALALTRVLRSALYQVAPGDPVTYLVIVAVLGLTAFVASWIPARRASLVDPVEALRRP